MGADSRRLHRSHHSVTRTQLSESPAVVARGASAATACAQRPQLFTSSGIDTQANLSSVQLAVETVPQMLMASC